MRSIAKVQEKVVTLSSNNQSPTIRVRRGVKVGKLRTDSADERAQYNLK